MLYIFDWIFVDFVDKFFSYLIIVVLIYFMDIFKDWIEIVFVCNF